MLTSAGSGAAPTPTVAAPILSEAAVPPSGAAPPPPRPELHGKLLPPQDRLHPSCSLQQNKYLTTYLKQLNKIKIFFKLLTNRRLCRPWKPGTSTVVPFVHTVFRIRKKLWRQKCLHLSKIISLLHP